MFAQRRHNEQTHSLRVCFEIKKKKKAELCVDVVRVLDGKFHENKVLRLQLQDFPMLDEILNRRKYSGEYCTLSIRVETRFLQRPITPIAFIAIEGPTVL